MAIHQSTHASLLARLGSSAADDAWREFHDRYHSLIHGFAVRRGLQPLDADDVTQDVLMRVHQGIRDFQYDPQRGRFRGFLKTIALRVIWSRRAPAEVGGSPDDLERLEADAELEDHWEFEWRQYHLRLGLARLRSEFTAEEFRIFEALAVEGRPTEAVAAECGVPADRLYRIKSAVLGRLRQIVAEQTAEEG